MSKVKFTPGSKTAFVRGTNIAVTHLPDDSSVNANDRVIRMIKSIDVDDDLEVNWTKTLRPERSLIHPAEAFLQGQKKLRPSLVFSTFDSTKAKSRRAARRVKEQTKALHRRTEKMAPTAAMKAVNLRKIPKTGGHATNEEAEFLSRGKANKRMLKHLETVQSAKKEKQNSEALFERKKKSGAKKSSAPEGKKKKLEKIGSRL